MKKNLFLTVLEAEKSSFKVPIPGEGLHSYTIRWQRASCGESDKYTHLSKLKEWTQTHGIKVKTIALMAILQDQSGAG
jgi:hypothetical protein